MDFLARNDYISTMILVYILAGIIVAILVGAAWMPRTFNIEKNIIIDRPMQDVMNRIGNLNDYSLWNPWQQSEPTSTKEITGSPYTAGHRYAWSGKKIGVGRLTLRSMNSKNISFDLEFFKPWKSKALDNWHFDAWGENGTKVTWQNTGNLPWPIARLMGPMLNKNLGIQFQKGLENLKSLVEKS